MTVKIIATVATKAQTFTPGTIEGKYVFVLKNGSGATVATIESVTPNATFEGEYEGGYYLSVTKNGVTANATVAVPTPGGGGTPTSSTWQVPTAITVTFG